MYAGGHCEELLGVAIRESGVPREQLYLTSKVKPEHLGYADVQRCCDRSLKRLGVEYLDLYLVHWPNPRISLRETFRALNQLVRSGRVRRVGVSNFDVDLLRQAQQLSETAILTNQVPYSLRDRSYADNGVLEYCQKNDILLTAYTPLGEGGLQVGPDLAAIAEGRAATAHQVALSWLISQPRVIAIPMSTNPRHQKDNLAAGDILLAPSEMILLG